MVYFVWVLQIVKGAATFDCLEWKSNLCIIHASEEVQLALTLEPPIETSDDTLITTEKSNTK